MFKGKFSAAFLALFFFGFFSFVSAQTVTDAATPQEANKLLAAFRERLEEARLRSEALRRIADENIKILSQPGNAELEERIRMQMAKVLIKNPELASGNRLSSPIEVSYKLLPDDPKKPDWDGGGGSTKFVTYAVMKNGELERSAYGFVTAMQGTAISLVEDCAAHEARHTVNAAYRSCKIPPWADEGLATLEERPESVKRLVYDKLKERLLPQLSEMVALSAYPQDVNLFYAHGAAFSKFLMSRFKEQSFGLSDEESRVMVLGFSLFAKDKGFEEALRQYKAQLTLQAVSNAQLSGKVEQEFREWLYLRTH